MSVYDGPNSPFNSGPLSFPVGPTSALPAWQGGNVNIYSGNTNTQQPVQQPGFFNSLVPQTNTPLWGQAAGNLGPTASLPGVAPGQFNINPAPQPGQGPFGTVPGPVGLPNPAGDLNTAIGGGLPGLNNQLSQNILGQLQGRLSPETLAQIQDFGATRGQASGMPGSGLGRNRTLRDLGLTTQQVQQQGISNYNQTIPTISRTQTVDPSQQIQLAQWNAINRAAPDPGQAAAYAKTLFDQYLAKMRGPGGGTGGGGYGAPQGGTVAPTGGGYSGPVGFGFNDLAPGSGGGGYAYDPLDEVFGTDPGTIADLGNWWEQPVASDTTSSYDQPIDYASSDTGYDPMADFGSLGF